MTAKIPPCTLEELGMSYDEQGFRPFHRALKRRLHGLRVERRETLIKDHQFRILQKRPCNVDSASLAVRELPAAFSHHLHQSAGHALKQIAQAQLVADCRSLFGISSIWRPGSPH